ncbi:lysozyme family protein [Bacillus sp. B15-48]|uniref:lysozyme family protein n=1 Tax=Bacillus sp. B15-48 TaxID=1548601 RepID=UPI00193F2F27|nr:lysozyme family protein [Bacillus sp. B15-48]MBM4763390.1 hypothetical protein [Bacillus sp. B15-48]
MKRKHTTKQAKRNFNLVLVSIAFLFLFNLVIQLMQLQERDESNPFYNGSIAEEVYKYTPVLEKELKNVNLEQYTVVLAAIMQQESRGRGGDPMQASESAGLAPNSINNPEQSIKQGVKHFKQTFDYGTKKQVDFATVIQSYNMGMGYIDFVAQNGDKHSEELAKEFSYIQVQKNPSLYNCGGDTNNFRYPYCYGDFSYSGKVLKNIETLIASNPELSVLSEAAILGL